METQIISQDKMPRVVVNHEEHEIVLLQNCPKA